MSRVDLNDLNSQYVDVFKELGNIGAGNASTALAHMLNMKVDMSVPEVSLLEFKDAGSILGGEETIVCGVYLSVQGDITGSIMFLLDVNIIVDSLKNEIIDYNDGYYIYRNSN